MPSNSSFAADRCDDRDHRDAAAPRQDIRLDAGWRSQQGNVPGAEQLAFDDAKWESVGVPHNWGSQQAQPGETDFRGPC